ncbi:MAG: ribosome-binding factor A [Gammaproteobacteria bacterium]|jgi:ribosome-binding factor A|nr:ribosome-binding factor A [Gammaproteobacteria bacterium]|tara:strand:+ start:5908 stop:6273 length:366 start_codon:yes stop_codon:yes gene_type:complete
MKYDSDNQRVHRINSVLMKEIAKIIQSEINDPRIKNVVITEVQVSKDLKNAKIFFIIFNQKNKSTEEISLLSKAINSSKLFFKKKLSENSNLRSVPNLRFIYDNTESKAFELEELINKSLK